MKVQLKNSHLEISVSVLVNQDVDAIVCSANNWLVLGTGSAGQIHKASRGAVQRYCDQIVEARGGPLDLGTAISVPAAGDLKCRHVIHAIGVGYKNRFKRNSRERILATPQTVFQAVQNALRVGARLKCENIAFPIMCAREGYSIIPSPNSYCVMATTMILAIWHFSFTEEISFSRIVICIDSSRKELMMKLLASCGHLVYE